MYYPCSENKGADQLRGHREADLRLCFRLCKLLFFSCTGSLPKTLIGSVHVTSVTGTLKASLYILRKSTTEICIERTILISANRMLFFCRAFCHRLNMRYRCNKKKSNRKTYAYLDVKYTERNL